MSDLIRKSKQLQCKQNISDKLILHVKGVFSVVGPVFKIYKNGGNNCNDVSISVVMLAYIPEATEKVCLPLDSVQLLFRM